MINIFGTNFRKKKTVLENIRQIGGGTPDIKIGHETYINQMNLYCWRKGLRFIVGNYCSIAESVDVILGGEHDLNWVSTYPFIERWGIEELMCRATNKTKGDIIIGSDVWIGHGVTILSGSTIGNGAVVGARSLVSGEIPPFSVAVGIPAKVIKKRFSDDVLERIIRSNWWELKQDDLRPYIQYMSDPDVFLRKIGC